MMEEDSVTTGEVAQEQPDAAAAEGVAAATTNDDNDRCSVRNCPLKGKGVIKHRCAKPGCLKWVHLPCYQQTVLNRGSIPPLDDGAVACTKNCHNHVSKSSTRLTEILPSHDRR